MRPRHLLIATSVIEMSTGLALALLPALVARILIGIELERPGDSVIARVCGTALLTLGAACWLMRKDNRTNAAKALVASMLFYNAGVAAILAHACLGLRLSAVGLWPAVLLHLGMSAWSFACLRDNRVDQFRSAEN